GWQETTVGIVTQLPGAITMLHISITLIPAAILLVSLLALGLVYRPLAKTALGK
ncbi:MAG: hypothetical protein ACI9C3_002942, partial [Yoonia sp.]